jgi:hypothetical protein
MEKLVVKCLHLSKAYYKERDSQRMLIYVYTYNKKEANTFVVKDYEEHIPITNYDSFVKILKVEGDYKILWDTDIMHKISPIEEALDKIQIDDDKSLSCKFFFDKEISIVRGHIDLYDKHTPKSKTIFGTSFFVLKKDEQFFINENIVCDDIAEGIRKTFK